MAIISVPVANLKQGDQIVENVMTKKGNLLMEKGRFVAAREIEVLQAFFIPYVSIESKNTPEVNEEIKLQKAEETAAEVAFHDSYQRMIVLLRQVFNAGRTGSPLPILEIRTQLEAILLHIEQYNMLNFVPKNLKLNEYYLHQGIMVSLTAYQLAKWHSFLPKDLIPIALGGLFHDIGNVKIDPTILTKSTQLTPNDIDEIRSHTILGYQIIKNLPAVNEGVKLSVLQHHEREDGSGYPLGLKGDRIHIYSKVIAIADIFHAMTNNRQYRKNISPYLVLENLFKDSFGKLEPGLVQSFIQHATSMQNGSLVRLSDNRIGEIVFSDRSYPTRPWVNVHGSIINLMKERNLYIQEVVAKFN